MFNPYRFASEIIRPTLQSVDLWSVSAERLLLGTALIESRLNHFHQINGPALGVYQMEPATHDDIWANWLAHRVNFSARVKRYAVSKEKPTSSEMVWNLAYATLLCRIHYVRVPIELPHPSDFKGMADYWKIHYNTHKGKGKVEDFLVFMNMYGNYKT